MELTKKTTILFPPDLHEHLTRQAEREGTSLGELVRRACRAEYGFTSEQERRRALDELLALDLPVGEPRAMKQESTPTADEILRTNRDGHRPDRETRCR